MKIIQIILEKDKQVSKNLAGYRHSLLDSAFESYTSLGSLPFNATLALLILVSGHTALFRELATVLVATLITTEIIKKSVDRRRPQNQKRSVYTFRDLSFPSGHAANSFATAVVLTGFGGLGHIPLLLAGIVAFSRIYLETHYISDVLVGSAIGIVIASLL